MNIEGAPGAIGGEGTGRHPVGPCGSGTGHVAGIRKLPDGRTLIRASFGPAPKHVPVEIVSSFRVVWRVESIVDENEGEATWTAVARQVKP